TVAIRRHRHDLLGEDPLLERGCCFFLTAERELVLILAAHLELLCDVLGGDAHRRVDAFGLLHRFPRFTELFALYPHHAHGFDTTCDGNIDRSHRDYAGCSGDRLQAARAEAVDGLRARFHRQTAKKLNDARDVEALLALGHRASEHEVFDDRLVDLRI